MPWSEAGDGWYRSGPPPKIENEEGDHVKKKQAYEKPLLRKVRLEVKTSVLAACHFSTAQQPMDDPIPGAGCRVNQCFYRP